MSCGHTMTVPKLGIVIPVGDSENFINKFISNYLSSANNYDGIIETVLVCNNSTKNCFDVLKSFENSFLHVYDIGQCSNGISKARNYGLKMLNDDVDFVSFLDDDDSLNATALRTLPKHLNFDADIVCFEWTEIQNEDGLTVRKKLPRVSIEKSKIVLEKDLPEYLVLPREVPYFGYCWAKLYKKNLLINNDILFNENVSTFEDVLFFIEALAASEMVKFSSLNFLTQNYIFKPRSRKASFSYLDFEKSLGFVSVAEYISNSPTINVKYEKYEKKHLLARYTGYLFYFSIIRNFRERNDISWWKFANQVNGVYASTITRFSHRDYFCRKLTGESTLIGELHRRGFVFIAILASIYKSWKEKNR